jgi:NTE family protein
VLQAIEEAGIPIDMVLGTSMGSLVGGLYVSGYSPEEMRKIVVGIDWNSVFVEKKQSATDRYGGLKQSHFFAHIGFNGKGIELGSGLLKGQNVLTLFTGLCLQTLAYRNFDDLPVPYRAVATDVSTGERVVLDHGSIAEAARSSMSIPALFSPYFLDGRYLVDGGLVDNLPVGLARSLGADIVIAVDCHGTKLKKGEELRSAADVAGQTVDLVIEANMRPSRAAADLCIAPDLEGFNSMSYSSAAKVIERGLEGGRAAAPALRALASRIAATRPLVEPAAQANRRLERTPRPIASLEVEGGTAEDRAFAQASFSPFVGTVPDAEALAKSVDTVYATGRFDFVKYDLLPQPGEASGSVLVVRLVREREEIDDTYLLGTDMRLVGSSSGSTNVIFSNGLLLRGLTGKSSALFVEVDIFSKQKVYAEHFQPLGPVFVLPWVQYSLSDYRYVDGIEGGAQESTFRTAGGGAWAGFSLGKDADLMGGYSLEWLKDIDVGGDTYHDRLARVQSVLRIDTRSDTAFADRGVSVFFRNGWADPVLGGESTLAMSEMDFTLDFPLSDTITLGLRGYGATDYSNMGMPALDPSLYFSLKRPGMFYGLEDQPVLDIGDQALASSVELRKRVGPVSRILGGDVYLLGNLSAGFISTAGMNPDPTIETFRWNASAGFGLRITKGLGLLSALSLVSDHGTDTIDRVALSIELGAFDERIEDQR